MNEYGYAKEKLFRMITTLATSDDDLRTRLKFAFLDVAHVKAEVFPQDLQSEWESIWTVVRSFEPVKDEDDKIIIGQIENTLKNSSIQEVEAIAMRIVELYVNVWKASTSS